MNKGIKFSIAILMLSGVLYGCGNGKMDLKVGNGLSSDYSVIDSNDLDINKSMYYSIDSKSGQKGKVTMEVQNEKDGKEVLKEDVPVDENKKINNIPVSFNIDKDGEYKAVIKNENNKILCEKKFKVKGQKIENPNKKEVIKKSESKEVKQYNEAVQKVKAARNIKNYECLDVAKKAVAKMNNSEKKTTLTKELNEIKQPIKVNKTVKGQYKSVFGVDVVETDLDYSKDYKAFVDYQEVKTYETSKNKIRFSGKKNSNIFISNGKETFKVVF